MISRCVESSGPASSRPSGRRRFRNFRSASDSCSPTPPCAGQAEPLNCFGRQFHSLQQPMMAPLTFLQTSTAPAIRRRFYARDCGAQKRQSTERFKSANRPVSSRPHWLFCRYPLGPASSERFCLQASYVAPSPYTKRRPSSASGCRPSKTERGSQLLEIGNRVLMRKVISPTSGHARRSLP